MIGAAVVFFLAPQVGTTVNDILTRGGDVYAKHCAVPYCHGSGGSAGRAPAIAGRTYERPALRNIVANGTRSGMPAFRGVLPDPAIDAVVAYVLSLPAAPNSSGPTPSNPSAPITRTAIAGRDLFFDSARMPSCSACHGIAARGGTIARPLRAGSALSVQALRGIPEVEARRVHAPGEASFVGLVLRQDTTSVRIADLTAPLPVVRTFQVAQVKLEPARWNHETAVRRYSQSELVAIADFIRQSR